MSMLKIIFGLSLFFSGIAFGQSPLDGKNFSITLKVSGEKRLGRTWTRDELTFKDMSFTSKEMGGGEHFPPFAYTLINDSLSGNTVRFIATGENPGWSTIAWEGKVKGNKIEGLATWTNRNGPQKQLFKGKLLK